MNGYGALVARAGRSRLADPYAIGALVEKRVNALGGEGAAIGLTGALAATGLAGLGVTIALVAKAKYAWAAANFLVFTPMALMVVGGVIVGVVATSHKRHMTATAGPSVIGGAK